MDITFKHSNFYTVSSQKIGVSYEMIVLSSGFKPLPPKWKAADTEENIMMIATY